MSAESHVAGSQPRVGPLYLSLVRDRLEVHQTWSACNSRVSGIPNAKYRKCQAAAELQQTASSWGVPEDQLAAALGDLASASQSPAASPATPPTAAKPDEAIPDSRHIQYLLCTSFLPVARAALERAGFVSSPAPNAALAYRLRCQRAIVEAYVNGRIQRQGTWREADDVAWAMLGSAEDEWLAGWLKESVGPSQHPGDSDEGIEPSLVAIYLSGGRLTGWVGERLGRYSLVRREASGETIGALGRDGWVVAPEESALRDLETATAEAQGVPDRSCAAMAQLADGRLGVAVTQLSLVGRRLSIARDWGLASGASPDERARILAQAVRAGCCQTGSWDEPTWRKEAVQHGNQLDLLFSWFAESACLGADAVGVPVTWPLDLIMRPPGGDDWAQRLTNHYTIGRARLRRPIGRDEEAAIALSGFLACSSGDSGRGV